MSPARRTPVVLVHGNFVGPWSWRDVTEQLADADVPATTVRLPSSTTAQGRPGGDLHDDVAQVQAALDDIGARSCSADTPTAEP